MAKLRILQRHKRVKHLSPHPFEVIAEVCRLKEAEQRLRVSCKGYKVAEVGADASHLRELLRLAVQDQENILHAVAERLRDLVTPSRRKAVA